MQKPHLTVPCKHRNRPRSYRAQTAGRNGGTQDKEEIRLGDVLLYEVLGGIGGQFINEIYYE